jgi:hypothetical protein
MTDEVIDRAAWPLLLAKLHELRCDPMCDRRDSDAALSLLPTGAPPALSPQVQERPEAEV